MPLFFRKGACRSGLKVRRKLICLNGKTSTLKGSAGFLSPNLWKHILDRVSKVDGIQLVAIEQFLHFSQAGNLLRHG